jgi:hypothetical protein
VTETSPRHDRPARAASLRAAPLLFALLAVLGGASETRARDAGDPIVLHYEEGDVMGLQTVFAEGGERAIGTVEYRQRREGNLLSTLRIGRFADGSSDEDLAIARIVNGRLEALRGHQIMRDPAGKVTVEVSIDVERDRVRAEWGPPGERESMDESVELPAGTYWGPLVFIVLKNFEANAENDRLAFHTVAPTPRPRMLDLELVQGGAETLERPGLTLATEHYRLRPALHWIIDPILAVLVPDTSFWTLPGEPPGLALFKGPRNYGRERIVLR